VLLDISVLVQPGTPEWPGDVPFTCGWSARIEQGSSVNLSHCAGSPHVGTHADAPLHVRDDWPGSDRLPLEPFLGPVMVLDVTRAPAGPLALDADDPRLEGCERLLLRTDRTIAEGVFPDAWPVLSPATAILLAAAGVMLVGAGAYVLENLDLRGVAEGPYELIALPQRLGSLDAAPVRAALRQR